MSKTFETFPAHGEITPEIVLANRHWAGATVADTGKYWVFTHSSGAVMKIVQRQPHRKPFVVIGFRKGKIVATERTVYPTIALDLARKMRAICDHIIVQQDSEAGLEWRATVVKQKSRRRILRWDNRGGYRLPW